MGKLHNITIQLVDARLEALQHQVGGNTDNAHLDTCVQIQRELKRLLGSGDFRPDYGEGLILFNNCQAIAESLLEKDNINKAQEVFETECLLLTHSDFGREETSRASARMAEHTIRLFLCLPPEGAAERFRPFINTAMNALPDPAAFPDALAQAMAKLTMPENKSADPT